MKLKVSVKITKEKNGRNAHRKYVIRGFDQHLPYVVAVAIYVSVDDVLFFVLLLR